MSVIQIIYKYGEIIGPMSAAASGVNVPGIVKEQVPSRAGRGAGALTTAFAHVPSLGARQRGRRVLGMLNSLEVKVLWPT